MKTKFNKAYSLSTDAIKIIAVLAKEHSRNPSDFLDFYFKKYHGDRLPKKKSK